MGTPKGRGHRFLRPFLARLRWGAAPPAADEDFDAEVREHIRLLTERYIREGMTSEGAARAARLRFGNTTLLVEERHDMQTWPTADAIWRDLRYSGRMLRRNPGFTATIVLTLAFGIGANTAIFSICDALLLKPLPYSEPERIVMLWEQLPDLPRIGAAPANFVDWRRQARSFSHVAAVNPFPTFVLGGSGEAARLAGAAVSWDFFTLLGVRPSLGRGFLEDEDQPGRNRVAMLSHDTWISRFGGRRDIIGTSVLLNDTPYSVIGVLPEDFEFVAQPADFQGRTQFDVWTPLALNPQPSRGTHPLRVFARLRPGVTLSQAQADVSVVAGNLARAYPGDNTDRGIGVVPLRDQVTADVRPILLVLLGAVGFVLLIACANVASLLLSRGTGRSTEMSVRVAMGAGLRRITQQLVIETLLLGLAGGALGLALGVAAVRMALPYLPAELSRATGVAVDARIFLFTLLTSLGTGLLCGLGPLVQAWRLDGSEALSSGTRVTGGLVTRLRGALVVGQLAVTCILLIGAGLMTKSLWTLLSVPTGFQADHLLTARQTLPRLRFSDAATVEAFQRRLLGRLYEVPGVQSAGVAAYLPFSGDDNGWAFAIEGRPPLPTGTFNMADYRPVTRGYFETIGLPLRRGRAFVDTDEADAPYVVVINESMARAFWKTDDPIGQRLRFGGPEWRTVVGVVGDLRHEALDKEGGPEMYVPFGQAPQPETVSAIVVRTSIDASAMTSSLRQAVASIDPAVPLDRIETMEQLVWSSASQPRFRTFLLGTLALLALVMASIGIYGVTSYSVRQRTREFGIYMTVGATARDVLRLVLRQSARLIAVGLGLGLVSSFALVRIVERFLYGVTPLDAATFLMVSCFLATIACVASYIPARWATRIDPVVALRHE
jgi:putative ABC transport system permease protein